METIFFAKTNLKSTFKHDFLCVACEIYLIRYCDFKSIQMSLWASKKREKFSAFLRDSTKDLNYSTNQQKKYMQQRKMPDFLFVMQINGAANEPKSNGYESMEV